MARPVLRPYQPKPRYIPKQQKHEESIQRQVCSYLRIQYPHVIFRTDFTAGRIPLTQHQARQYAALQSGRAFPDIFIYHPRKIDGVQYAGMGLELKTEGTRVYLKNGERSKELHIQEQFAMMDKLRERGYYAVIAVGFDEAVREIDKYMGKPENARLTF